MSVEAAFFSSNPFLRSLSAFVRRETGGDGDATAVSISAVAAAFSCEKPSSLACLSPEVLSRLRFVDNAAAAAASSPLVAGAAPEEFFIFGEDGRVQMQWSLVKLAERGREGEEDALAEGARLAVACHSSLRRTYQRRQQQQQQQEALLPREQTGERLRRAASRQLTKPATSELPGVIERILGAESDEEEVYVGLCVCLIVLERALYDIYRQRASNSSSRKKSEATGQHDYSSGVQPRGERSEGVDAASLVAPAMILRDLIATPEVEAALPEQMLALLRLLLLPMGFNIRNLVWHGFLAPRELPRELASLVLLLTLSLPTDSALSSGREARRETDDVERAGEGPWSPPPQPPPLPPPPPPPRSMSTLQEDPPRSAWWPLDSFDTRLACPPVLTSAVESLLSAQHREELDALVRRSAFVLPGREDVALLGLRALGGGRSISGQRNDAFLLVALLPVLEHGLRCLFCCVNDSPGHLFAHLRQYYSTLDGFGQRAKHQLLLDQTLSGCPGRNLLLAALGPGLSAVLLDLFMMSAGPNLRGKVAHGEIDMAGVLPLLQPRSQTSSLPLSALSCTSDSGASCSEGVGTCVRSADIVRLTAAVFLVLCRRYDPGSGAFARRGDTEEIIEHSGSSGGGGGSSNPSDRGSPPPMFSGAFVRALDAADASCSRWVPRFHPHELLEADLRDCRDEFNGLAIALERRVVSVDMLPGGDLACMTVVVSGGGHNCSGDTLRGSGEAEGKKKGSPPSTRVGHGEGGKQKDGKGEEVKGGASPLFDARLVLTVTDSVSRLVPPRVSTITGGVVEKPTKKGQDAATSGVYPGLARVNEALDVHALSLADRFKSSAARSRQHRETGTSTSMPASSFAAHYCCKHSHQPDEVLSCGLHDDANDKARRRRRISPPTNVITASPLPQMPCVSGLCRACAQVARGLRQQIVELEALLAAGSARSKQRRAYATLLRVAPTLLRFLGSAVAAVELFVIEWDRRTPAPSPDGEEAVAQAAGAEPPGPGAAAGLSFLRRLAAVIGALCVTPGESSRTVVAAGHDGSRGAGKDGSSCDEGFACKKKGFAQALAELASFLETKTARQGFATWM